MQNITRQKDAKRIESNVRELEVFDGEHRPSWKVYGKGTASLKISAGLNREWISLVLAENAQPEQSSGRWTTKEAHLTLDHNAARAVYELLHEVFGTFQDRPLVELEILARQQPFHPREANATPVDVVGVTFRRDHFVYTHNGIQVERERAVELLIA